MGKEGAGTYGQWRLRFSFNGIGTGLLRRSRHKVRVAHSTILSSINLAAALVTIAALLIPLVGAVLAWLLDSPTAAAVGIATTMGILAGFGIAIAVLYRSRTQLATGYRFLTLEIVYRIDSDDPCKQQQLTRATVKSVRPMVNLIAFTSAWTGTGTQHLDLLKGGVKLLGPVRVDRWSEFYVHLGRPLHIGEERTIEVRHDLYDAESTFQPFVSRVIRAASHDVLTLRAILPPGTPTDGAVCHEETYPGGELVRAHPFEWNVDAAELRATFTKPRRGHRYVLRWG